MEPAGLTGSRVASQTFPFPAQGKQKCRCKAHYVGDGLNCEPEQMPVDRCLQDHGQCHADAHCTDLHFQGELGKGGAWASRMGRGLSGAGSEPEQTDRHK